MGIRIRTACLQSNRLRDMNKIRLTALAAFVAAAWLPRASQAQDLAYLRSLLDATPQGGWVQANTNKFSDAWLTTGPGALPDGSYSDPSAIVKAWSSFAWDSNRGNLLLWGGGHANYMGNEMYVWQGSSGTWTRGSLASRLERYGSTATYFTVDNAAPQSAHTYDNTVFMPINDRYVTFGGAAFNTGGAFTVKGPNGDPVAAGPWLWDPSKADPNKVGGTDGSGYSPAIAGGNMWSNQAGKWTGIAGPLSHVDTNSAYVTENGKDVVYITRNQGGSGFQSLYRYQFGDVQSGELGVFEQVGRGDNVVSFQSAATIDTANRLYVHTSADGAFRGLGVWDLDTNNAANPGANQSRYITLKFVDGTAYAVNRQHGIAFDDATQKIILWDGRERGVVYETAPEFDASGNLLTTWTVRELESTTAAQPNGLFGDAGNESGVLGKFQYVSDLDAFIALDNYSNSTQDAGVWLYKPFTTPVPEPTSLLLMLGGLGGLLGLRRNRRAAAKV